MAKKSDKKQPKKQVEQKKEDEKKPYEENLSGGEFVKYDDKQEILTFKIDGHDYNITVPAVVMLIKLHMLLAANGIDVFRLTYSLLGARNVLLSIADEVIKTKESKQ